MGWMSWTRFACNVNCDADPEYCISERLIVQMADRMVEDGYLDAGWDHLVIDDCWASKSRDDNGYLQVSEQALLHLGSGSEKRSRGLKLVLYFSLTKSSILDLLFLKSTDYEYCFLESAFLELNSHRLFSPLELTIRFQRLGSCCSNFQISLSL